MIMVDSGTFLFHTFAATSARRWKEYKYRALMQISNLEAYAYIEKAWEGTTLD